MRHNLHIRALVYPSKSSFTDPTHNFDITGHFCYPYLERFKKEVEKNSLVPVGQRRFGKARSLKVLVHVWRRADKNIPFNFLTKVTKQSKRKKTVT